jgi:hypothetical protein
MQEKGGFDLNGEKRRRQKIAECSANPAAAALIYDGPPSKYDGGAARLVSTSGAPLV